MRGFDHVAVNFECVALVAVGKILLGEADEGVGLVSPQLGWRFRAVGGGDCDTFDRLADPRKHDELTRLYTRDPCDIGALSRNNQPPTRLEAAIHVIQLMEVSLPWQTSSVIGSSAKGSSSLCV